MELFFFLCHPTSPSKQSSLNLGRPPAQILFKNKYICTLLKCFYKQKKPNNLQNRVDSKSQVNSNKLSWPIIIIDAFCKSQSQLEEKRIHFNKHSLPPPLFASKMGMLQTATLETCALISLLSSFTESHILPKQISNRGHKCR